MFDITVVPAEGGRVRAHIATRYNYNGVLHRVVIYETRAYKNESKALAVAEKYVRKILRATGNLPYIFKTVNVLDETLLERTLNELADDFNPDDFVEVGRPGDWTNSGVPVAPNPFAGMTYDQRRAVIEFYLRDPETLAIVRTLIDSNASSILDEVEYWAKPQDRTLPMERVDRLTSPLDGYIAGRNDAIDQVREILGMVEPVSELPQEVQGMATDAQLDEQLNAEGEDREGLGPIGDV